METLPNILHLLVALGAAGCLLSVGREARGRLVAPARLLAPPLLAAAASLFLFALVPAALREPRLWLAALALGAVPGAARGFTLELQVDHMWTLLRLPHGRDGLWAARALAGLAALAVALALASGDAVDTAAYAALASAGAAAAAGYLAGRALALWLRTARTPHLDLRRF